MAKRRGAQRCADRQLSRLPCKWSAPDCMAKGAATIAILATAGGGDPPPIGSPPIDPAQNVGTDREGFAGGECLIRRSIGC